MPVAWSEADGLREPRVPHEGGEAWATGINSRGGIVGSANDAANNAAGCDAPHAVRWPAETVESMPDDGPYSAMGVDEDGTVLMQKGVPGRP